MLLSHIISKLFLPYLQQGWFMILVIYLVIAVRSGIDHNDIYRSFHLPSRFCCSTLTSPVISWWLDLVLMNFTQATNIPQMQSTVSKKFSLFNCCLCYQSITNISVGIISDILWGLCEHIGSHKNIYDNNVCICAMQSFWDTKSARRV